MSLPYKLIQMSCAVLLAATFGFAAAQTATQTAIKVQRAPSAISQPSLGEIAREVQAERARMNLKSVPRYTNDNVPKEGGGLSVIGPSELTSGAPSSSAAPAGASSSAGAEIAYLRHELARAQTHLRLHLRELAVLQQQISQSKMQWYPNPSKTLMQEYSRSNISGLADKISGKQQEIAQDQQGVANLNDQLERAQARYGWVRAAGQARASASQPALPPGVKSGTPEYWQAMIQSARERLQTAEEEQGVAKNELSLLKLQQLRSLDPNVQANLAAATSAKREELNAAAQAVASARKKIEALKKEAQQSAEGRH